MPKKSFMTTEGCFPKVKKENPHSLEQAGWMIQKRRLMFRHQLFLYPNI